MKILFLSMLTAVVLLAIPNMSHAGSCLNLALKKISIIEKNMPEGLLPFFEDDQIIQFRWSPSPSRRCVLVIHKAAAGNNADRKVAGCSTIVPIGTGFLNVGQSYDAHPLAGFGRVTVDYSAESEHQNVICDGP